MFRMIQERGRPVLEVFATAEAAHSSVSMGRNEVEDRDDYDDSVWNVATAICINRALRAAGLKCRRDKRLVPD